MKRKLLSFFTATAIALMLIPTLSLPVAAVDNYDLWIGGIQVTSDNKDDVLSDGTVSYNPTSNTLTLSGVTMQGYMGADGSSYALSASMAETLNIVLVGDNRFDACADTGTQTSYGIHRDNGDIVISGSGSLYVESGEVSNGETFGMNGSFVLTINDSAKVTAIGGETAGGGSNGVSCSSVVLNNSAYLKAESINQLNNARGCHVVADVTANDNATLIATVPATSKGNGISGGAEYLLVVNGGTVIVEGGGVYDVVNGASLGMWNKAKIYGGAVTVSGAYAAWDGVPVLGLGVTAIASTSFDGADPVPYNPADNSTYKWVQTTYTAPPTHIIAASAGTGGSISPNGDIVVDEGDSETFAITPARDYVIESVTVDGINQGALSTYTFSDVTTGHTIAATFVYIGGYSISKTYHITNGANGEWESLSDEGLEFTADGDYNDFLRVEVDDEAINSPVDYTAKSGSTIIMLNPEYLKTLSMGEHKLTIIYIDGSVSTNFKLVQPEDLPTDTVTEAEEETLPEDAAPKAEENPTTGNSLSGLFAVALVSLTTAVVTIKKRKIKT